MFEGETDSQHLRINVSLNVLADTQVMQFREQDLLVGIQNLKEWQQWKAGWPQLELAGWGFLTGQVIEVLWPVHTVKSGDKDKFFPAMVTKHISGSQVIVQWCEQTSSQNTVSEGSKKRFKPMSACKPWTMSELDLQTNNWRSKSSCLHIAEGICTGSA